MSYDELCGPVSTYMRSFALLSPLDWDQLVPVLDHSIQPKTAKTQQYLYIYRNCIDIIYVKLNKIKFKFKSREKALI